jgi:MoxR-like ATPase
MPADILGTHVLTDDPQGGRRLIFQRGPVFTSVLLADEVNRATPKTQSALLEAMAERQVTIGGTTHTLPQPFFVLATQNPLEMEGTYPLPEAQLDRFFVKVLVPFPDLDTLSGIVDRTTGAATPSVPRVLSGDELLDLQRMARAVALPDPVKRYAIRLVLATHPSGEHGSAEAKTWLRYGASPRGVQALVSGAKVRALLAGRVHASFDDVRRNALPVLRHRVIRGFDAEHEGRSADTILAAILGEVKDEGALADERAR